MDYSVFRPKRAEKKEAPTPAPAAAPAPEPKPTPQGGEGSGNRFRMDPYMDAWGGGGRYFTDMADHFSSNRRLNQIEFSNTRRIIFHFNEFDGSDGAYYDAPPWSNRRHYDDQYDDYHSYGRHPYALPPPPRTTNYMLPPPPMQSPSPYYGGDFGYEAPYYSLPPPPPARYPSYYY